MVGARVAYRTFWFDREVNVRDNPGFRVQPFLRYYFLDLGQHREVSLFGEAGFGTFNFADGPLLAKDINLGLGAEASLSPGVVAALTANYHVISPGRNAVSVAVGLNLLTGLLTPAGATEFLHRGSWVTNGQIGRVLVGGGAYRPFNSDQLALHLRPRLGYVFLPGLLLEASAEWQRQLTSPYSEGDIDYLGSYPFDRRTVGAQLRYYPLRRGQRLFPFVSASGGKEWLRTNSVYGGPLSLSYGAAHLGGGVGASYRLSDRVALDLSTTYRHELLSEEVRTAGYRTELPKERFMGEVGWRYLLQ